MTTIVQYPSAPILALSQNDGFIEGILDLTERGNMPSVLDATFSYTWQSPPGWT
jgi:hypothetical protein